jgi:cytoskeleton protein RodZ
MGAGEAWRREREARGMTLEEAASALRISRKYLRGIEEGDYAGWPERVFSSGYVRAYAKLLSMDPEPVLSEYFLYLEQREDEQPQPYLKPEWLERERQRGSRRTTYALAAVAVLFLGMLLAWYGTRMATRPVPVAPQTGPPAVPGSPRGENAAKPALPAAADNAGAVPADNVPVAGSTPAAGPAPAAPAPPASSVAAVGGIGPVKSPYQLFIEASDMSWMMYTLDNDAPVDVMLYPGDKISIQAQQRIVLKLGNAGGVVGTLNGKLLPPFGARGQVKEIRLGD